MRVHNNIPTHVTRVVVGHECQYVTKETLNYRNESWFFGWTSGKFSMYWPFDGFDFGDHLPLNKICVLPEMENWSNNINLFSIYVRITYCVESCAFSKQEMEKVCLRTFVSTHANFSCRLSRALLEDCVNPINPGQRPSLACERSWLHQSWCINKGKTPQSG